ncbi:cryptochrome/photolyase family protein [Aeromonas cavernicola]|uniref:Cryptochrome/photolyase family protein n=1 Tax=Aeromonas cavernicola TaxID=1006623 RepID=A0A2H9U1Q7_9GAMM|nr:cryptochrome/photolyase family protein [Aeromonas cavernicola]PJG57888.1 cryptochrome/photolyase family protein [Aeromonas cavernicola]
MELRLILGDQLNASHSWFRTPDPTVYYLIAELRQETDYCRHHRQKVLAFFAAMRAFAAALTQAGHQVCYLTLDDTAHWPDLPSLLESQLQQHQASSFAWQSPDEWRLANQLTQWAAALPLATREVDSEHFLTPRDGWQRYPHSRMEFFYRTLRKQYQVLLDAAGHPLGGRWNFDGDNRAKLPRDCPIPAPLLFANKVHDIDAMLTRHGVQTIGQADANALPWPVTRRQSRQLLDHFLSHLLPSFGRYQDALSERGWSLFHSRLSFSLNSKMLHPLEVIRAAEAHWQANQQLITLPQVEGFIRQILGWREFVRALYWEKMPAYRDSNFLHAQRPLPPYFWHGQTKMACVRHAITQSLEHGYAHHIQRLMVTGNFALLAGINPTEVDEWYLGIYVDAIEWVELPNTRGMSQFADGGLMGSKPYASSGAYLDRMGHYCKGCHYQVKARSGEGCCPFNPLYWHFLWRHRDRLGSNARLALPYANWDAQPQAQQQAVLATAEHYLSQLASL